MPTGYTAGVMEGTVTSFEEFARQCMRAFVMHMRDDPWDTPYEAAKPSDYYQRETKVLTEEIAQLKKTDEDALWALAKTQMEASIKNYVLYIKESRVQNNRLDKMLVKVKAFVPPTEEHAHIRDFMVSQLSISFKKTHYFLDSIKELKKTIKAGMPIDYKKTLIAEKQGELRRAKQKYADEVAQCQKNSAWCEQFLKAIEAKA